jgi:rubrerythrin
VPSLNTKWTKVGVECLGCGFYVLVARLEEAPDKCPICDEKLTNYPVEVGFEEPKERDAESR